MKLNQLVQLNEDQRVSYFSSFTDLIEEFSVKYAIISFFNIKKTMSKKDAKLWLSDVKEGSIEDVQDQDHIDECDHCNNLGHRDPECEFIA